MHILYLVTAGPSDPTRATIPLHIAANGSVEVGQQATVALAGYSVEIVLRDNIETIEGVGLPPMSELVTKLRDHQVPIYI